MDTFRENSIYALSDDKDKQWKSLNERFTRWQDRQMTLLTFSINLFFTISVASFVLILNNFDKPIFQDKFICGCPLTRTMTALIVGSMLLGVLALLCRLCDFRLTTKILKNRKLMFKIKNNVAVNKKYRGQTQTNINNKLGKLNEQTECLGVITWCLFTLQTITFSIAFILLVFKL